MSDILHKILVNKREEVEVLTGRIPEAELREKAQQQPPALDFTAALKGQRPRGSGSQEGNNVNIIAEIKRRSPSKGTFRWHGDMGKQVAYYEDGGASAISVVTDAAYFGGSLQMLNEVKGYTSLPVMHKEFVVSPWQLWYTRAQGVDAVLLLANVLKGEQLAEFQQMATEMGLHTLVEVVNEEELERAKAAGAKVIGVNHRDLTNFSIDNQRLINLLPGFGDEHLAIAESGIHTRSDVERLMGAGVDGFLVGEALMTHPRASMMIRELRGEL